MGFNCNLRKIPIAFFLPMKNFLFLSGKWQILLMALVCTFLTFNIHSKSKINTYHHVLWADAAGYYVYLPALFEYGFHMASVPDSLEIKTGKGFRINRETNTIETKYTYGVAFMQIPFYMTAHLANSLLGLKQDGFGEIFHWAIMLSGVFYSLLGMYFLKKALRREFSELSSSFTVLIIFTATPLFYYGLHKTSFAHIYLFAIFSFVFYYLPVAIKKMSFFPLLLLCSALSLSVLIRPTSILLLPLLILIQYRNREDLMLFLNTLYINIKKIILPAALSLLVFVPQFLYWYYLSGSFLFYSYEQEGFTNLLQPRILEFWFSPNNGLFLYTPLMILLLVITCFFLKKGKLFFGGLLLSFLLLSYVFSSWHDWTFGCSYGSRSFTEYYLFMSVPLATFISHLQKHKKGLYLFSFCLLLAYIAFVNINTIYAYDDCYYGGTWDFKHYFSIIKPI